VSLISSGTSSQESAFLDASESGGDVFFLTAAALAGQDVDNQLDVYDAHECSGSPCIPTTSGGTSGPCTSAEACRNPRLEDGSGGEPSSEALSGEGNAKRSGAKVLARRLTRARLLARALRACRRKPKHARAGCRRAARRRYGFHTANKQTHHWSGRHPNATKGRR
jgi:hypothetical protein